MSLHTFSICAYKESPYLEDCISSLLSQKSSRSGVIICTSAPNEHIRGLALRYDLPLYIREGKSCLRDDWNFAVECAVKHTGAKLVTVAHQDDIYDPCYSRALVNAYEFFPDMSVFCTAYNTIDAKGEKIFGRAESVKRILRLPLRLRGISDRTFIKKLVLRFGNSIGCPTCTYNTEVTGLPVFKNDYSFVIDWDALLELSGKPGRFVCVEKPLMSYRVHDGAATKLNIVSHNREREELIMYEKLWPRPVAKLLMHFYKSAYKAYD